MDLKTAEELELRTPKGTLDYSPEEVLAHNKVIDSVVGVFRKHGGVPIDTPTFELRSILTNKYGEESKLMYNLEKQGGDVCSLRYDLTVPFARYISMNRISRMRRYQVGRVYRRDNPSFKTGRLREFIQADFDICGDGLPMLADAEALAIVSEILENIGKPYVIRVNDRRIITGMLRRCGVAPEKCMTICSTVDKADKLSWGALEEEFRSKGLDDVQIAYIREYMEASGDSEELLRFLESKGSIGKSILEEHSRGSKEMTRLMDMKDVLNIATSSNGDMKDHIDCRGKVLDAAADGEICDENRDLEAATGKESRADSPGSPRLIDIEESKDEPFYQAIEDLRQLLKYIAIFKVQNVKIDLSLARGLDYYTGMIIEASIIGSDVGSIVGGGRYDNLCKSMSKHSVACVGFSVGVSRLYAIMEPVEVERGVFVGSAHGLLVTERLGILEELWRAGITAETFSGRRVNFKEQLETARKQNFRLGVFTGENEVANGVLGVVDLKSGEKREVLRSGLASYVSGAIRKEESSPENAK